MDSAARPMSDYYRVRTAFAADEEALVDLSVRTVDRCYRCFLGEQGVDDLLASGRVEGYVRDGLADCLVMLRGQQPCGYMVCEDNLIRLMMIDHRWHGRGLGSLLLGEVESQLFTRHARLWMEGYAGNQRGIDFCYRRGWRPVSNYPDGASGATRVVFEKDRAVAG